MGEFNHRVERQRLEEEAKGFMSMHTHSLNSMWYDTRPQDTEDGKMVTDIQYNNGILLKEDFQMGRRFTLVKNSRVMT